MLDSVAGYRLEEVLDQDGLVTRFRAFERDDRGFEHESLIHVLSVPTQLKVAAKDAFEEDAAAAAALTHERLDVPEKVGWTEANKPYLVTAASRAKPLPALMESRELPPQLMLRIAADVAEALEALHGAGLPHGMLRPNAVWVDENGFGRLGDLGFGRAASMVASEESVLLETHGRFYAPEQVAGESPSPEADRFAFASLMYELLTGKPAFDAPTILATTLKISMAKLPPMDELDVLSDKGRALFRRLFARTPGDRPAASELTHALQSEVGRESDDRRFLAERVAPPPAEDPSLLEFAPFDLGSDDPTSLQTELPNHIPEYLTATVAEPALPMPTPRPPADPREVEATNPLLSTPASQLSIEDLTAPIHLPMDDQEETTQEEDITRARVGSPGRRRDAATLVLEAPAENARSANARWRDRTMQLEPEPRPDPFAPPVVARPPPPAPRPPRGLEDDGLPDLGGREGPHPALLWVGIGAGAVAVMALVAVVTVLLAS